MKRQIYVSVLGATGSGKTAIVKLLAETLKNNKIQHHVDWGPDGPSMASEEFERRRVNAIANKSEVYISERPTRRGARTERPESYKDLGIIVQFDPVQGYGIEIMVLGHSIQKWFGDFRLGKDRARMLANRLGAEMDLEVIDIIPNDKEWVQSKDHE